MANNSVNLSSLDFDTLKENFKTYLSTQSVFKDYNFDGSNINVLLDVMSYNTYLNAFYLNMVASEMFLDSAQKYDTVVSHAKELNYTPRSAKSAVANLSIDFETTGITVPFTIPKNTLFTGTNSNGTYSFCTRTETTYVSPNTDYSVTDLQIYEGSFVNNSFIMNYTDEIQKFVLPNENIDVNSLTVTVYENNQQDTTEFTKVDTLFGLTETSNVYFVQSAQDNQYEILFGDGFLGRKPLNQSLIVAEYMIVNGSDCDGISEFTLDTDLGSDNGGIVTTDGITVESNSSGGANAESIESIRFFAPRYFATQQRAVSTDDYSSIVLSKFGGSISDVNVYGGQDLDPKQYGRVVLCLKPSTGTIAPDYIKNQISSYMLNYISLPTRTIITDPDYLYLSIDTSVQYNKNITTKLANDIKNLVRNAIGAYSSNNLELFENDFRYSKFVREIDDADVSITSNETDVNLIKKLYPKYNYPTTYQIKFNNEADYSALSTDPIITSSYFTYVDADGTNYTLSKIKDDNDGTLIVYSYINNIYVVLNSSLGTIDYDTGVVQITRLNVSDYSSELNIYMRTKNKDIIVNKDKILMISLNDVNITVEDTAR